jgi:SAM-dependent methyltransferase
VGLLFGHMALRIPSVRLGAARLARGRLAQARLVDGAKARVRGRRTVSSIEELDEVLVEVDEANAKSHDAGMAALSKLRFASPTDLPSDPDSDEYREYQLDFYRRLSSKATYEAAESEVSAVTSDASPSGLYPYSTGSAAAIGQQLVAQGFAIETMNLASGSRVVEFGSGWGHLTLQLALSGCDVTSVEINPGMGEIIRGQAVRNDVNINVVVDDMLAFRPDGPVDAAIFFESFHHCLDFPKLLDQLDDMVAPDGMVAFVAEPISAFPYPWGLRLDGLSLWSIRREGWCELGFSTGYFRGLMEVRGWALQHKHIRGQRLADVWIARRA